MPSNTWPSASRSHCSRPHRFVRSELGGALADRGGGEQLAGREDPRLVDVVGGALVGDRERRQPVDLVAPEVDADRVVVGGRVHVDDRAADGDLAPRLHLVLPPVAARDQRLDQLVAVDLPARPDDDRLDLLDVGPEPLHQRPHRRDHDRGRVLGMAEPPEHAEAPAHGLERRRHPLERQRLPRREQLDLAERGEPAPMNCDRSRASRSASAPVGTATTSGRRVVAAASAETNSGRAASGTATAGARAMTARSAGSSASIAGSRASGRFSVVVAVMEPRERDEDPDTARHPGGRTMLSAIAASRDRPRPLAVAGGAIRRRSCSRLRSRFPAASSSDSQLNRFIATSTPSVAIDSTASAACSMVTSISARSRFENRRSTWSTPRSFDGGLSTPIRTRW